MVASITLDKVCLDYIVKSGTDSLKKTIITLGQALLRSDSERVQSVQNQSYRALNNVSLNIRENDRVGLLGRNGAGKSTLLRVMAKVYSPNFGSVDVQGKVASLFDVCLGMDFEATGYENIVHLAIMRGFTKKDALAIIPDVEGFTELGRFLNAPVRTYSSGMLMKLAFAVATAIPTQILLIDEVIGAGDTHFMKKATNRIKNIVDRSQILVLTSHSNEIIRQFCNKVIVLDKGEIQFSGDIEDGIKFYETEMVAG